MTQLDSQLDGQLMIAQQLADNNISNWAGGDFCHVQQLDSQSLDSQSLDLQQLTADYELKWTGGEFGKHGPGDKLIQHKLNLCHSTKIGPCTSQKSPLSKSQNPPFLSASLKDRKAPKVHKKGYFLNLLRLAEG